MLFPRPAAGAAPLAVLVNISGGLAGGDRIDIAVRIGAGAAATVTTQAAEKIYRSLGPDARVETVLAVAEDARLEWLPQETILFDGACLDRSLTATLARGGRLLACETLVFGRAARGEIMRRGRVRECWRIEYGGRLAWVDRLGLSPPIADRLDGAGFGGARALATALYAGPDAGALVAVARAAAEQRRRRRERRQRRAGRAPPWRRAGPRARRARASHRRAAARGLRRRLGRASSRGGVRRR